MINSGYGSCQMCILPKVAKMYLSKEVCWYHFQLEKEWGGPLRLHKGPHTQLAGRTPQPPEFKRRWHE